MTGEKVAIINTQNWYVTFALTTSGLWERYTQT